MQRNSLTANTGTTQASLTAKLLTRDEVLRVAANIAKLPGLVRKT